MFFLFLSLIHNSQAHPNQNQFQNPTFYKSKTHFKTAQAKLYDDLVMKLFSKIMPQVNAKSKHYKT